VNELTCGMTCRGVETDAILELKQLSLSDIAPPVVPSVSVTVADFEFPVVVNESREGCKLRKFVGPGLRGNVLDEQPTRTKVSAAENKRASVKYVDTACAAPLDGGGKVVSLAQGGLC
jgi:hypothetical protein